MAENDERAVRRLGALEEYIKDIEDARIKDLAHYKSLDELKKAGVERFLQLINDTELEILALLYKRLYPGMPANVEAAVEKLKNDVSKSAIDGFNERRRLRNLLVHAYAGMRYDNDVFAQSSNLKDVKEFIKEIKKMIGNR